MVNVWRLMAHHDPDRRQPMIQWATDNNRIAIGWIGECDLTQYTTPQDIQDRVDEVHRDEGPPGEMPTAGIQLWNFRGGAHSFYAQAQGDPHPHRLAMQCGDLVILKTDDKHGGWPQSVVMRVQGPYEYIPPGHVPDDQPPFGYRHQREAVPTGCGPQNLWNVAGGLPGVKALHQNWRQNALVRCQFPVECQDGQIRRVTDG